MAPRIKIDRKSTYIGADKFMKHVRRFRPASASRTVEAVEMSHIFQKSVPSKVRTFTINSRNTDNKPRLQHLMIPFQYDHRYAGKEVCDGSVRQPGLAAMAMSNIKIVFTLNHPILETRYILCSR